MVPWHLLCFACRSGSLGGTRGKGFTWSRGLYKRYGAPTASTHLHHPRVGMDSLESADLAPLDLLLVLVAALG
jgi:hypothetical protein